MANVDIVSPDNLNEFKENQDAYNEKKFPLKGDVPIKVSQLQNDSDYQSGEQVAASITEANLETMSYKGEVENYDSLPKEDNKKGDFWNTTTSGIKYLWDGEKWITVGSSEGGTGSANWTDIQDKPSTFPPDPHQHPMSDITDLPEWTKSPTKPSYTPAEIGAATADHVHATITTSEIDTIWSDPSAPVV